jgi:phage tail tape-measure protein
VAKNRVQIIISAADKGVKNVVGKVQSSLSALRGFASKILSPIGLITGGAGAFGLGLLGKGFVDTASSFEDLELSLTTTLGTMEKAKQAIAFANKEAAASPFTVMEYAEAIRTLSAYGVDYTKTMTTLGNTAAAMGKPLQMAVEALSDALQGEGERLKEFGIKQRTEGDNLVYTWVDKLGKVRETIAKNNPEIIQQVLLGIWNEKYKGGMAKFADAWSGLTSTAKSLWDDFKRAVMDSGPFQSIKAVLKGMIDEVNRLKESGKFDQIAANIGGKIVAGIKKGLELLPGFAVGLVKAAEMLVLAFSGWKQINAAVDIILIKLKIWSLEFLEGLRDNFLRLMEALDKIPGVDTSEAQVKTLADSSSTQWRIGDAQRDLEQAEISLGKIQVKQDETAEKFKKIGQAIDQSLTRVASDAWLKVDEAQKLAEASAAGVAKATKVAVDQQISDLDRYVAKLKEAKAAQQALGALDFRGGNYGGSLDGLESAVRQAERTGG